MRPLDGRRVGLLEARKRREVSELVSRVGGIPVCAPALREVPIDTDTAPLVGRVVAGEFDLAMVMTAAAFTALCDAADRLEKLPSLRTALGRIPLACRGPKPMLALRRHGLSPAFVTGPPHTSAELLDAIPDTALAGRSVLLLHYGERSVTTGEALARRGAVVADACLYEWQLPDDVTPIERLVHAALQGELDVVLFTSQVQCRHLLMVAAAMGVAGSLVDLLRRDIVVAAIGPTCAVALREAGIVPDVIPDLPNSASLVRAVADYFSLFHGIPEVAE